MTKIDSLLKDLEKCQLKSEDDALGFAHYRLLKNDIRAALVLAYESGKKDAQNGNS